MSHPIRLVQEWHQRRHVSPRRYNKACLFCQVGYDSVGKMTVEVLKDIKKKL
jgi:hypothetical protein